MMTSPTVFIVEDDLVLRYCWECSMRKLGLNVETYASAEEFLAAYDPNRPGCLVLDLGLPGMSGLELLAELRARHIDLPTLVLSGYGSVGSAVTAMKLGALDYLEKPVDFSQLVPCIRQALRKAKEYRQTRLELKRIRQSLNKLTPREQHLLRLIVAGKSNKQIALELGISIKTVANHRAHLMHKTGAVNAADLARMATAASVGPDQTSVQVEKDLIGVA